MQTYTNQLHINPTDLSAWLPDSSLFMDIETTGLSAKISYLYLIGCAYQENNLWYIKQWLAESPADEPHLLRSFTAFASQYHTLIHYNGTTFDIPYLAAKCKQYEIVFSFEAMEQLDLYRLLQPYRHCFPLPDFKQKTVEQFLGLHRKDLFSGGELIPVYTAYIGRLQYEKYAVSSKTENTLSSDTYKKEALLKLLQNEGKLPHLPASFLRELLLLHNREDISNLPLLVSMLAYLDVWNGKVKSVSIQTDFDIYNQQNTSSVVPEHLIEYFTEYSTDSLMFRIGIGSAFPVPFSCSFPLSLKGETAGTCTLTFAPDACTLTVPLCHTVKSFYENPKDYFYLTEENIVCHKSVASFVDARYRRKAKPEECCYEKNGLFLPQFAQIQTPVYYKAYKDKISYFEVTGLFLQNTSAQTDYVKHLLSAIWKNKPNHL